MTGRNEEERIAKKDRQYSMKIACFDVDMTLYDHRSRRIPESAMKTLDALREAGYKIFITTGRDMYDGYCAEIVRQVRPDGMVHCNGGRVEADGQILKDDDFSQEFMQEVFGFAQKEGLSVGAIHNETGFITHIEKCHDALKAFFDGVGLKMAPVEELPSDEKVYEMFYYGDANDARRVEEAFPTLRLPMYASGNASDVIRRGNSKANGLALALEHFGASFADVVACGDSNNDLELLEAAGLGIAMGNGSPEAKAAADYVTDDIARDGIYKAFRHFDLIPDLGI